MSPQNNFARIVFKGQDATPFYVQYLLVFDPTGLKARFVIGSGGAPAVFSALGTTSLDDTDRWYHVAGTYDKVTGDAKIYVDGILEATDSDTTGQTINGPVGGQDQIGIGRAANANAVPAWAFDGLIDDVRIYNRALNDAEIAQLATTFTITKELVSADEDDETTNNNSLIDLNEEWAFVLKVTLTNNGPGNFTNLTVIDPLPGDNELGNDTSRLKKNYTVKDPDDSDGVCPNNELTPSGGTTAEAFGTGNSAKCHVTWDIPVLNSLGEVTLEMNTSTDVNPRGLRTDDLEAFQEYTFTGAYCLNQGATLLGTAVEVPFEQESNGIEVDNVDDSGFVLQEDDNCNDVIESGTPVNVINVFVP